eukprot:5016703-Karenia_brevis.AAC.1
MAANRDLCTAIETLQKRVQKSTGQLLQWEAWVSSTCFDAGPWVSQDGVLDSQKNNTVSAFDDCSAQGGNRISWLQVEILAGKTTRIDN